MTLAHFNLRANNLKDSHGTRTLAQINRVKWWIFILTVPKSRFFACQFFFINVWKYPRPCFHKRRWAIYDPGLPNTTFKDKRTCYLHFWILSKVFIAKFTKFVKLQIKIMYNLNKTNEWKEWNTPFRDYDMGPLG